MARRRRTTATGMAAVALVLQLLTAAGGPALAATWPPAGTLHPAGHEADGLAALLGHAPDLVAGAADPQRVLAAYASPDAQFAALGLRPSDPADRGERFVDWFLHCWDPAVYPLELFFLVPALQFGPFGSDLEGAVAGYRAALGFDAFQVDAALQVLDAGARDSTSATRAVALVRGRFDGAKVREAWARTFGAPTEHRGLPVYARPTASRFAGAAALLGDGTVVLASSAELARAAIDADAGRAPALGDRPEVTALIGALPAGLAGALLLDGSILRRTDDGKLDPTPALLLSAHRQEAGEAFVASWEAAGPMPPVRTALLAATPGRWGTLSADCGGAATSTAAPSARAPDARIELALLVDDPAAAERAAGVVAARLETLPSVILFPATYAQFFPERAVWAVGEASVVRLRLGPAGQAPAGWWFHMHRVSDLWFVYW